MDVYKGETEEIIRRFRSGTLNYPDCLAALDAALAGVVPYLAPDQTDRFRAITAAANETVMREMALRKPARARAAAVGSQESAATQ